MSKVQSMDNILNVRHGKFGWEITYKMNHTFTPMSNQLLVWYSWLLLLVLYDVWAVPLLLSFNPIAPMICNETWLNVMNIVGYVCFAIDIYIQLHTSFYSGGNLVRNAAITRSRYLRSRQFLLDIAALLPLSAFETLSSEGCGVVNVNKLLRMRNIPFYTLHFDKIFARYLHASKIFKVVTVTFFVSHYIACGYAAFGRVTHDSPHDVWNLRDPSEPGEYPLLSEYFAALFWSLGIVSKSLEGAIPKTLAETMFMVVVMLSGFLLFVYICGTLFMISQCNNAKSTEQFEAKLNQLRHVLSFHRVPQDIQDRAIDYMEQGFKSGDADDRHTMKLLCPSLARDVKFTLLKRMVAGVPFFNCCSAAFVRALVDLMETLTLPTNFVVTQEHACGDDMYFVQSGVLVEIIDNTVVRHLRPGQYFSELAVFLHQVNCPRVVTLSFCILHKLSRSHIRRVLRAYPQFEAQILHCVHAVAKDAMKLYSSAQTNQSKLGPTQRSIKISAGANTKSSTSGKQLVGIIPSPTKAKRKKISLPVHLKCIKKIWLFGRKRFLLETAIRRKSFTRFVWILLVMTTTIYNIVTVPLVNAFELVGYPRQIMIINTVSDIVLWMDIYGKFNLSPTMEAEQLFDTLHCALRYFRSSFAFDFVCAFPWWIFYPSRQIQCRFVRLLRIWNFSSELNEVTQFIRMDSRRQILALFLGLCLCYHLAGCVAHSLTLHLGFGNDEESWLPPMTLSLKPLYNDSTGDLLGYNYMDGAQFIPPGDALVNFILVRQYARALLYGAVCLTDLGRTLEPEKFEEFVVAFGLVLSGMLLVSMVIDEVQKRVTASAVEQMEFLFTRSRILRLLQQQKTPPNIHRRVVSYLDFWWSAHRGANINSLLAELPVGIQREIFGFICAPLLSVLAKCDGIGPHLPSVSEILLDNAIIHLVSQGEVIFNKGDFADSLYFTLEGEITLASNLTSNNFEQTKKVRPGGIFGYSSLTLDNKAATYTENAIAQTACVVVSLQRPSLALLEEAFPSFCSCILPKARKIFAERRGMVSLASFVSWKAEIQKKDSKTIDPDSNFIVIWETILFICMVLQLIYLPFFMAFGLSGLSTSMYDTFTVVIEAGFLVDIFIKVRTGFYAFGNKITDMKQIQHRYLRSFRFAIDILATLPIGLVNAYTQNRSEFWNLNKLLRMLKLSSQIDQLERHFYYVSIQIRLFKLIFYTYLLAHFIGCTWYSFANNASAASHDNNEDHGHGSSWLPDSNMAPTNHNVSTAYKYTRSLYWGLGLLLGYNKGGRPETPLESVFTMLVQTTGVFLLAYIVGNLLDIARVVEGSQRLFYRNLNYVRKLTQYFKFTDDIRSKIEHFYFYNLSHSIHEEHVLTECLPPSLVADIRLLLLTPILNKVPFFHESVASANVLRSLVRQFTQVLVTRHEVVCRQFEFGVEMYIVFAGSLGVYIAPKVENDSSTQLFDQSASKGVKVAELQAGSIFGERSLFWNEPRSATIEAKTFCTLYKLSRTHLDSVFAHHPEWKAKVIQIAQARQREQTAKAGEETKKYESVASEAGRQSLRDEISGARSSGTSRLDIEPIKTPDIKTWIGNAKKVLFATPVQSPFYCAYLRILCWSMFFVALRIPYILTFGYNSGTTHSALFTFFDIFTVLVFAFDVWFKLHLVESTSSRELYEHRLQYNAFQISVDVVTFLPFDFIFQLFGWHSSLWKFNRLLKLRQMPHIWSELHRYSMYYELNQLKLLTTCYLLICYWTACGTYGLTLATGFSTDWTSSLPIEYFDSSIHASDFSLSFGLHQFLRCFYYSLNIYTGTGAVYEPTAELHFAFHLIVSVFGVFIMGYVIGEGSTLCIYLIQNEVDFQIHQMSVMEFIARKHIDVALHGRLQNYLSHWWSFQQGVTYQVILEQMPPRIRARAFIEIARLSLSRFALRYLRPLVSHTQMGVDGVVYSIARRLVYEGYPAGESIVVEGNIGHTMYFVCSGVLMTASHRPHFVAIRYETGQYFGDEGLLVSRCNSHSVVTLRACDLLALPATHLIAALKEHGPTTECLRVASEIATHHSDVLYSLETDWSVVGLAVSDIVTAKRSEFRHLSLRDDYDVILASFFYFFLPGTALPFSVEQSSFVNACQHCEIRLPTIICTECHQVLCKRCSAEIHEDTPFSFHKSTLMALEKNTTGIEPPQREKGLRELLLSQFFLRYRRIRPKRDISTTGLDTSSSFLVPPMRRVLSSTVIVSDSQGSSTASPVDRVVEATRSLLRKASWSSSQLSGIFKGSLVNPSNSATNLKMSESPSLTDTQWNRAGSIVRSNTRGWLGTPREPPTETPPQQPAKAVSRPSLRRAMSQTPKSPQFQKPRLVHQSSKDRVVRSKLQRGANSSLLLGRANSHRGTPISAALIPEVPSYSEKADYMDEEESKKVEKKRKISGQATQVVAFNSDEMTETPITLFTGPRVSSVTGTKPFQDKNDN
ncbi:hypothetical protein AC1031_015607 [Aphanomyces cochlioides]|nr:hypothetical protein AC1031_015607 [Aphanomyces cochlioides]